MEFYLHIKIYPARIRAMWERKKKPKPNHHNTGKKTHFHRLAIKQNIFHFCLKFLAQPRDNFLKQNGRAQRRMAICKWTIHKHWKRMNILDAGQRCDFFEKSLAGCLACFPCLFLSFLFTERHIFLSIKIYSFLPTTSLE